MDDLLKPYLDEAGRITEWADDEKVRRQMRDYLAKKIDTKTLYTLAELDAILDHHEAIQAAKGLGKRPWLERAGTGFYVRDAYRTSLEPLGRTIVVLAGAAIELPSMPGTYDGVFVKRDGKLAGCDPVEIASEANAALKEVRP